MFCKIREKVANAPLSKKFLMMLLPGILLFAFFILAGFLLIIRSGNHMLYQTSGELLSYSAKDISRNLQSVQGMANFYSGRLYHADRSFRKQRPERK